jgi:DHA3 family multidrug efflux protein-like MFS transporter
VQTFHRLVANTLVASVTNNFVWFALTFWVYLETRSIIATSVIGGGYMLLLATSGLFFGTFVDRHRRKMSMLVSNAASLACYCLAALVYALAPDGSLRDLSHPAFWLFIAAVLSGAISGNLRSVALSTTVTLLVPEDKHQNANGLVGTVNGVSFAITSVFSGLAIGLLGMGWCVAIAIALTSAAAVHLWSIHVVEGAPAMAVGPRAVDLKGAIRAVRAVPGLLPLLYFSTFNNLLAGVFMALTDAYGLSLVSVEAWGMLWGVISLGFIVGGVLITRRGLGANPVRTLLLVDVALWVVCVAFPIRSAIAPLVVGFFVYMALVPAVEACEQTIVQRLVPLGEQGRVFGFAQSVETAASPVTAFLIGPTAQLLVIPFMTDGAGADAIGGWFGTGAVRGMALMFIVTGLIGLAVTLAAMRSRPFRQLSERYSAVRDPEPVGEPAHQSPTSSPVS